MNPSHTFGIPCNGVLVLSVPQVSSWGLLSYERLARPVLYGELVVLSLAGCVFIPAPLVKQKMS